MKKNFKKIKVVIYIIYTTILTFFKKYKIITIFSSLKPKGN